MHTLPYLTNQFGDRYLYDVNRGSFNQIGAANLFKQRFGDALFNKDCLTIVIGSDSGLLINYVRDLGVPDGSRFIFIEPDQLLTTIRNETNSDALDERVLLGDRNTLEASLRDINFSDYANIGNVRLIESLAASDDFFGEYRSLHAHVRQQLDSLAWIHNVRMSNPTFVRRQLENLIELHVPAETLRDSFSEKTAVLLGGGPSLDELLPWLKEHADDVVIIAVSRVCRRLQEAGIAPHLVASIDPTELSFDISKELLDLDPRTVFAHANHVSFPLLAQWRGRSVFLDRRYPWEVKSEPDNFSAAGPTVTNTAFGLAQMMGFSTILFAGIDLCHSVEGYSHARGSNEFDAGPSLGAANMRVKTNSGGLAGTTPDFFNAIEAFGLQAAAAREQGIRVINPSADAAVIDNVEYLPLDQLTPLAADEAPFDILHRVIGPDSSEQRRERLRAMQRELAHAHKELRAIIELSKEALSCNDGLFGRNGKTADFRYKKRMDKIERQLDNKHRVLSQIVRMFSARAFLHMPPSEREWTDEELEQAGTSYYTAYRDNAQQILELVEQAQHRVASAIQEESDQPDMQRLITQWRDDAVPGRATVWRHRHAELARALPDDIKQVFDELEREFRAVMASRDTSHAKKIRNELVLGRVRGKLQTLFKERSAEELDNVVRQLEKQSGDEARQLHLLGRGYLAELADEKTRAFDFYGELIEHVRITLTGTENNSPNPRLEDGLRRMAVIAIDLEQHEQALLVMQTLADISPAYQPRFAELLRLSGNIDAAINVYTDYLSKAPSDHATMLRLGKLYRSMGALEAASTAFHYILDNDPDNTAARALLDEAESAA